MSFFAKITAQEIVEFANNFSVMLKSGMAVNEALDTLAMQTDNKLFREILLNIKNKVQSGIPMSDAFAVEKKHFGTVFVSLIKVGESSGTMDESLTYVAEWLEREHTLKKEINAATVYPKFVFSATLMMGAGLALYILPKLVPLFSQLRVKLPLATRLLLWFTSALQEYWYVVIILAVAMYFGFKTLNKIRAVKRFFHTIFIKLPFVGGLVADYELALVTRLFETLLKSGLSLRETITITSQSVTNVNYEESLIAINERVNKYTCTIAFLETICYYCPMKSPQKRIAIMDFGGQSAHLISRRVRQFGFDVEIVSPRVSKSDLQAFSGIILSGGARSVYEKNAPTIAKDILLSGTPILGICYGHQVIAHVLGGKVDKGATGEYGPSVFKAGTSDLFKGIKSSLVWMNHRDTVTKLPKGFIAIGTTATTPIAAYESKALKIQSVQFHPEVTHTKHGEKMIENFLKGIGNTKKTKGTEIEKYVNEAKQTIGNKKAIIGLSGGVDSSVAAVLVSRAIGKNLCAVFVDTGFMRLGEAKEIRDTFRSYGLNLKIVDASKIYFKALRGISDPEQKRKIIGKTFIEIFDKEAKAFGATFLIQGTIYSDRIESGLTKHSSKIKSHHNVGGLPKHMKLTVYEPLRDLYKDEVRALAADLKLPDAITHRQVFPGPGFAIRVIGDLTPERVSIVQRADMIVQDELGKAKLLSKIWMAFPVLLTIKSVGIEGDERSYKYPLVLRIVESKDAMTANFAKIPHNILGRISTRITNEIREVNRVVYDISNKPPATMEWE